MAAIATVGATTDYGHADEEQRGLSGNESQQVLEHVGPRGRGAVEGQCRVVDLVKVPQDIGSVEAAVHEKRDEVEHD